MGGTGIGIRPGNISLSGRPFTPTERQADNVLLSNSTIFGWVKVTYTHGAVVRNNVIINPTINPAIVVYGYNSNTQIYGNNITQSLNTENARKILAGIAVTGTGPVDSSFGTSITNNRVKNDNADGYGIYVTGVRDVAIVGNNLQGAGLPSLSSSGVYLRTTLVRPLPNPQAIEVASVTNNRIANFGRYGLLVNGNGIAVFNSLLVQGNSFTNTVLPATETVALRLDDGTHALKSAVCGGNIAGIGVTQKVVNAPPGVVCNF